MQQYGAPLWQHLLELFCASASLLLVVSMNGRPSLLTNDDGNFGRSSGIRMNGRIEVLEVLGLVLQVNDLLLEVELLFDQSDPCSLRKWAPADRSTASTPEISEQKHP